jgi:hypothetical protein
MFSLLTHLRHKFFFAKGQGAPWEVKGQKGIPWRQKGTALF